MSEREVIHIRAGVVRRECQVDALEAHADPEVVVEAGVYQPSGPRFLQVAPEAGLLLIHLHCIYIAVFKHRNCKDMHLCDYDVD